MLESVMETPQVDSKQQQEPIRNEPVFLELSHGQDFPPLLQSILIGDNPGITLHAGDVFEPGTLGSNCTIGEAVVDPSYLFKISSNPDWKPQTSRFFTFKSNSETPHFRQGVSYEDPRAAEVYFGTELGPGSWFMHIATDRQGKDHSFICTKDKSNQWHTVTRSRVTPSAKPQTQFKYPSEIRNGLQPKQKLYLRDKIADALNHSPIPPEVSKWVRKFFTPI